MMRNAWHISGGEGWAANTTCKRVLVTHRDGRQTVEEIENDFDVDVTSREEVMRWLTSHGIDAVGVSLTGNMNEASGATLAAAAAESTPSKSSSTPPPPKRLTPKQKVIPVLF